MATSDAPLYQISDCGERGVGIFVSGWAFAGWDQDPLHSSQKCPQESLRIKAVRLLKSEVKLVVEPASETAMAGLLQASETVMSWRGTPGVDYCAIVFEPAVANEAITAPHIRSAPFQKNQYAKLVNGIIKARAATSEADFPGVPEPGHIASGDMYVTLDAGKGGPLGGGPGRCPQCPPWITKNLRPRRTPR